MVEKPERFSIIKNILCIPLVLALYTTVFLTPLLPQILIYEDNQDRTSEFNLDKTSLWILLITITVSQIMVYYLGIKLW